MGPVDPLPCFAQMYSRGAGASLAGPVVAGPKFEPNSAHVYARSRYANLSWPIRDHIYAIQNAQHSVQAVV